MTSPFAEFEEPLVWRQDRAPHATGTFRASVLHGESQSESAGPSRGTFPGDPWSVIVDTLPAACAGLAVGDTLTRADGSVLTVQQMTREFGMGVVIRCTSNARAPK